jgi:hypothetical protein
VSGPRRLSRGRSPRWTLSYLRCEERVRAKSRRDDLSSKSRRGRATRGAPAQETARALKEKS